jgi:hypothetical protein
MENIEFHPHMLIIFYLKCLKYPVFYLQIIININIKNAKKKKLEGGGVLWIVTGSLPQLV